MHPLVEKLPKKVKVGSFTYALELVEAKHPELEDNYGITLLEKGCVLLWGEMPFDRFVNTVLHEVGHCINHSYGLDEKRVTEEQIATQSANGWQQVYLDNPKLEMWLHKAYRELRKTR